MSAIEKANKPAPHKMLACDGGGIRGVLSVEIIAELESCLQQALGKDDSFVLADYFDYFAGTSTGACIHQRGQLLATGCWCGQLYRNYEWRCANDHRGYNRQRARRRDLHR